MGFIILTVLAILALIAAFVLRNIEGFKAISKVLFAATFVVYIFFGLISCVVVVPTGSVGIVTQFGKVTGRVLQPGFNLEAPSPFQDATLFDTKVQKEQQEADAASSDLQVVGTTIAVNYHLEDDKVGNLYQAIGTDYKGKIIDPAIQESVKSVTAKYNATELITNRPAVKDLTEAALAARLKPYGIIVDATSIVNFQFSADFNKAIEDKQVASQNVLAEQQKLDQIKVQNQELVSQAQAQHDANALLQQSLTPEVLQKLAIDKWDGHLPQYLGGGTVFNIPLQTK